MTAVSEGGKGNEKWYKSRRMWGAIAAFLLLVTQACVTMNWIPEAIWKAFTPVLSFIAMLTGATSWLKPK